MVRGARTGAAGPRPPDEVEAEYAGDVDGLDDVVRRYRADSSATAWSTSTTRSSVPVAWLLADPPFRAGAQRVGRGLLVDEFQDLTPAHLLLLRLLTGPADRVRGGRRRPDHLRLRRGRPRVAGPLRRDLPRVGRPPARGQLPLPAGGRHCRGQEPAHPQRHPGGEDHPARHPEAPTAPAPSPCWAGTDDPCPPAPRPTSGPSWPTGADPTSRRRARPGQRQPGAGPGGSSATHGVPVAEVASMPASWLPGRKRSGGVGLAGRWPPHPSRSCRRACSGEAARSPKRGLGDRVPGVDRRTTQASRASAAWPAASPNEACDRPKIHRSRRRRGPGAPGGGVGQSNRGRARRGTARGRQWRPRRQRQRPRRLEPRGRVDPHTDDLDALVAAGPPRSPTPPASATGWATPWPSPRPTTAASPWRRSTAVKGQEWPHVVVHHVTAGPAPAPAGPTTSRRSVVCCHVGAHPGTGHRHRGAPEPRRRRSSPSSPRRVEPPPRPPVTPSGPGPPGHPTGPHGRAGADPAAEAALRDVSAPGAPKRARAAASPPTPVFADKHPAGQLARRLPADEDRDLRARQRHRSGQARRLRRRPARPHRRGDATDLTSLPCQPARAATASANTARWRSTSAPVVAGHIRAMLWNGVSRTPRLSR